MLLNKDCNQNDDSEADKISTRLKEVTERCHFHTSNYLRASLRGQLKATWRCMFGEQDTRQMKWPVYSASGHVTLCSTINMHKSFLGITIWRMVHIVFLYFLALHVLSCQCCIYCTFLYLILVFTFLLLCRHQSHVPVSSAGHVALLYFRFCNFVFLWLGSSKSLYFHSCARISVRCQCAQLVTVLLASSYPLSIHLFNF